MLCGLWWIAYCLFVLYGQKPQVFSIHSQPWLAPPKGRRSRDSLPARSSDITGSLLGCAGQGREGALRRGGGASLGVSRETLQQMACLAALQWHICSTAGGKAIFGKSLLSQVQLVLIPSPPFNQGFYLSPTSFISGNEVSIFSAGTLSQGS